MFTTFWRVDRRRVVFVLLLLYNMTLLLTVLQPPTVSVRYSTSFDCLLLWPLYCIKERREAATY